MHISRPAPELVAPPCAPVERPASQRRALLAATLALSAGSLWMLRGLLPAALLGAWLAAVAEPVSARVARRLGGRSRSAAVLTLAVVLGLLGALALLVVPVVSDVRSAIHLARDAVRHGHLATGLAGSDAAREPSGLHALLGAAREIAPLAEAALSAAASVALQLFVFVVTAYYLAIDGRRLQAGLERVSPLGAENTRRFIADFVAVGRGIGVSMGLGGVATALVLGVTFVAVGAPRPMLLTAAAFVLAMVPVGAVAAWLPAAVWLAAHGHVGRAVALTVVALVLVSGVIDHGLRPYLVRYGRLELHPLLTILALFGGALAFGAWGVFLGPLLVALTISALRIYADGPLLARRSLVPGERVTVVPLPMVVAPAAVAPSERAG